MSATVTQNQNKPTSQTRPVRLFSTRTKGKWIKAQDTVIGEDKKETGSLRNIQNLLTDFLTSTNLVVLSGLGASLSIKDKEGNVVAPTMKVLWDKAVEGTDIDKIKSLVHYQPEAGSENIEVLLSKCKIALEFWPNSQDGRGDIESFVKLSEDVIKRECSFVNSTTELTVHQNFLRKIARRSSRKTRAKIFTSNYDLCFEAAGAKARFVVVDGFSHAIPQSYDPIYFGYDIVRRDHSGESPDYIESVFQLYKLHGSVDWTKEGGEIVRKQNPENPLLIYPRSSKYQQSFESPYIDMMAAFQSTIRQNETSLIVVGFGFNDDHISGPIMAALQSNINLRVTVVEPYFYGQETDDHELERDIEKLYHKRMAKLISEGDNRISFISATFEDFVEILPDLVAETDRERHAERFRKMRDYEENAK